MNANVEEQVADKYDLFKWLVVVFLICAVVFANSYYSDFSVLYRSLGVIAVGAIAAVIAASTGKGKAFTGMLKEARIEVKKVVWPTKQETLHTTAIVAVIVFVMALILWGLDALLGFIISSLIG